MTYFETELLFTPEKSGSNTITKNILPGKKYLGINQAEVLGITVRLGNRPLVYNLNDLSFQSGKPVLSLEQDHYLVVHAISAIRTRGNARVDELHYFATANQPEELQTIDLLPKTHFNEILRVDMNFNGCINLFGEVSLDVPSILESQFLDQFVDLGPGIKLQLSTSSSFIGKFIYTLQIPIVQASGVGSNFCAWVLKPDENKTPLLGDQLLIQSIAVPKGTDKLTYTIYGLVKADKGIFWKQQEIKTSEYHIDINLNQSNLPQR